MIEWLKRLLGLDTVDRNLKIALKNLEDIQYQIELLSSQIRNLNDEERQRFEYLKAGFESNATNEKSNDPDPVPFRKSTWASRRADLERQDRESIVKQKASNEDYWKSKGGTQIAENR